MCGHTNLLIVLPCRLPHLILAKPLYSITQIRKLRLREYYIICLIHKFARLQRDNSNPDLFFTQSMFSILTQLPLLPTIQLHLERILFQMSPCSLNTGSNISFSSLLQNLSHHHEASCTALILFIHLS